MCWNVSESLLGDKSHFLNHIQQKGSSFQGLAKYCEYSGNSVSIVIRLQDGQPRIQFPVGGLFFLVFLKTSIRTVGPTKTPIQWIPWALFSRVIAAVRDAISRPPLPCVYGGYIHNFIIFTFDIGGWTLYLLTYLLHGAESFLRS
jgi:hypothetical protein